ncbi:hypothetical protein DFH27DRAFT_555874 [Peziza echinospora]|nr:hypothetical protein DFH27DRAFT_555874 [Peziza echinospora]
MDITPLHHPFRQIRPIKPPQPLPISQSDVIVPSLRPVKASLEQKLRRAREDEHSRKSSTSSTKITEPRLVAAFGDLHERDGVTKQHPSTLDPMLQAVLATSSNFNLSSLDLITTRATLQRLFEQTSLPAKDALPKPEVKLYIELIQTPSSTVQRTIAEVAGSVLIYPAADPFTEAPEINEEKGESFLAHHHLGGTVEGSKIAVSYQFGGMRCLVRYDQAEKLQENQGVEEQDSNPSMVHEDVGVERGLSYLVKRRTRSRPEEEHHKLPTPSQSSNGIRHTTVLGIVPDEIIEVDDAEVSMALEHARRLEELQATMERAGLHPVSMSSKEYDNDGQALHGRQRADSASSVSSFQSQTSLHSIASSHSSVSSAPGDHGNSDEDHSQKHAVSNQIAANPHWPKIHLASSPVSQVKPRDCFDMPTSQLQFRPEAAPTLLDICAQAVDGPMLPFKSTIKYSAAASAWEKEHYEALKAFIVVLRKIRSTVAKTGGRCKVIVEQGGKVRSFRVKEGPRSVLSAETLAGWK